MPPHGGYQRLLSYQLAELIFDITVLFCEKYIPASDRTRDQMIQSGRSGFQNIAEGSVDSGISRKSEIKLTGVAIGCMGELAKDYVKYLKRKHLEALPPEHPALMDLKQRQVKSSDEFRAWVKDAWMASGKSLPPDQIVANGALSLLNLATYLTKRQLAAQEMRFLAEGGIAERMHRLRREALTRTHGRTRAL